MNGLSRRKRDHRVEIHCPLGEEPKLDLAEHILKTEGEASRKGYKVDDIAAVK